MRRVIAGSTLALGLALGLAAPAHADVEDDVIGVPADFVKALSGTLAAGHYELQGTGLHVWTDGPAGITPKTDKVAEYVATDIALAEIGEPTLDYTAKTGTTPPGFQLVVDFDGKGGPDGILVGEPKFYGDVWWLTNGAASDVKTKAPQTPNVGTNTPWDAPLEQWRGVFPDAKVVAFGFSLGSGVTGDGVINSIDFAGTKYTFEKKVVLTSKDECKDGGWATSTDPVYKNQGQCVSAFASAKSKAEPTPTPTAARQPAAAASVVKTVAKMWPFA